MGESNPASRIYCRVRFPFPSPLLFRLQRRFSLRDCQSSLWQYLLLTHPVPVRPEFLLLDHRMEFARLVVLRAERRLGRLLEELRSAELDRASARPFPRLPFSL